MSDAALAVEVRMPPSLRAAVASKLRSAEREQVCERVRAADASLWGPAGAAEISDRLGWLTIAERMRAAVADLRAFAHEVRDASARDVVLLGMGGSSLAPEVLRRCFGSRPEHPTLHVLDSTDAATIRALSARIEPRQTLFVVSSKSGGTIEPLSLLAHFWSLNRDGACFAAITDPQTELAALAQQRGFRRVFCGDPAIGGRYSALSVFGLVPGALIGVDVEGLLEGARAAWQTPMAASDAPAHAPAPDGQADSPQLPAWTWLGAALSAIAQAGRDKLTFLIGDSLPGLGLWLEQLVAESTGKQGRGILPVAEEPPGEVTDYGPDRVFAHLSDVHAPDPAGERLAGALADAGAPVITIPTRGPADLGRVFMLAELMVCVAGWGLEINPFDQPNVQQAKDATKRVLAAAGARAGEQRQAEGVQAASLDAQAAAVRELLEGAAPPAYVAVMGYLEPSGEFDAAVGQLRTAIRDGAIAAPSGAPGAGAGVTTTFGYGPRFLHSTGQFHKGGPRTGRFLQILHDGALDVEIPGAPYTFTTLKNAQATGDRETLGELGLPVASVRLRGDDPSRALRELTARLVQSD